MRALNSLFCAVLCLGMAGATLATAAPGACGLLTQAEIKEVVGKAASPGTIAPENKALCSYTLDGGSMFNITLTAKSALDSPERAVTEFKKHKMPAEVVTGIGDGGYATSPGLGMQQLGVYKGSNHVIVTLLVMGAPEAKVKAMNQALMKKALSKL